MEKSRSSNNDEKVRARLKKSNSNNEMTENAVLILCLLLGAASIPVIFYFTASIRSEPTYKSNKYPTRMPSTFSPTLVPTTRPKSHVAEPCFEDNNEFTFASNSGIMRRCDWLVAQSEYCKNPEIKVRLMHDVI